MYSQFAHFKHTPELAKPLSVPRENPRFVAKNVYDRKKTICVCVCEFVGTAFESKSPSNWGISISFLSQLDQDQVDFKYMTNCSIQTFSVESEQPKTKKTKTNK